MSCRGCWYRAPNVETLECAHDEGVGRVPTAGFDGKIVPVDELLDTFSRYDKTDFLMRDTSEGNRKP